MNVYFLSVYSAVHIHMQASLRGKILWLTFDEIVSLGIMKILFGNTALFFHVIVVVHLTVMPAFPQYLQDVSLHFSK